MVEPGSSQGHLNGTDQNPVWQYEKPAHEIDGKRRVVELQKILRDKSYSPEEQKPNIEMAIKLYQDGVLPWPVGEFVFIQDGQLWTTPKRLVGASCYWAEGVMMAGYGNIMTPSNEPGQQIWSQIDLSKFPEPTTDEMRARKQQLVKDLSGRLAVTSHLNNQEEAHSLRDGVQN